MKQRKGFVSNSSSSSFCILGFEATDEQLKKLKWEQGYNTSEYYGISNYFGKQFIGVPPNEIKDDETLDQFKERIINECISLGIKISKEDLNWYIDGGHD